MITAQDLRAARAPLTAFAVMGICWGSFAADLPDMKTALDVDEATLGRLLFFTPVAAVLAMLVTPLWARRTGPRAMFAAVMMMGPAFALPGLAAGLDLGPMVFVFGMVACGAVTGLTDILMTSRMAAIDSLRGKSRMNLAFAGYSFGYAAGALGTGVLRAGGLGPAAVMGGIGALCLVAGLMAFERDGRISGLERPRQAGPGLGLAPVLGGLIVFLAFLTENASENWAALYIESDLGGSPAEGAMGPAVFALTMGFARLAGQGFSGRMDPVRLLMAGAVLGGAGLLLASVATVPWQAYAGFVISGVGAAVISPTALALVAARSSAEAQARAIARTTLLGYFGYFVGPPGFGFLAGWMGLASTFAVAAGLLALVLVLAPVLGRVRR